MKNIIIFKYHGIYEWLIARISGAFIFFYFVYLLSFIFGIDKITYEIWYIFFSRNIIKCFNVLILFFVLIHSWIGINHVVTDYIKSLMLKQILQLILIAILFGYLLYGLIIMWNI
ncbi:succinate dehydrogenase, hydrophobic membrane anchor protein [Blochmannia endosymbiont of Camponotus (Colobopsis) obliquus]|uniref:succinate dehydrogenase, hydrophobic membrane anchor protein n=1 Tax=Blochmannia endosymbiont of Camponotus (Colobopsis) obliquus TaxID=1505597 RepID=UPI000696687B